MKKLLLIFIGIIFSITMWAQNIIAPDTLFENTVWNYDTVFLNHNLYIPDNTNLLIEPGTEIISNGYYKIEVQGSINATGNENELIKFTISDTTGFSDSSSNAGGWDGFIFNNTPATNDSSVFDYCILEYGKNIEDTSKGGIVYDYNFSKFRISNSIIQHNYSYYYGGGLYFENASPRIYNNEFYYNKAYWGGGGIYLKGATISIIHDNLFEYNSVFRVVYSEWGTILGGIGSAILITYDELYTNQNATIINNICFNNKSMGATIYESTWSAKIIDNLICNNFGGGILGGHGLGHSVIMNNTICNNFSPVGAIEIYSGAIKVINNIVWGNNFWSEIPQIIIRGSIKPKIQYNCIEDLYNGGIDGDFYDEGNIDTLPGFVNPSPLSSLDTIYEGDKYDYTLLKSSPCINRGLTDTVNFYIPQYDLAGNPRINNLGIDMGAFEYQIPANIFSAINRNRVKLYPNPGLDVIFLSFPHEMNITAFELYDITGKLVLNKPISSDFESFNITSLKQGIYFYRLLNTNSIIEKGKWVKQ
ncbi:MAG: T9SS type A sorting domain-containing protein [Chlorobi bacterium]|nr:T9SS type A sorting domain-containing protein [Chlorobiota bacterium]